MTDRLEQNKITAVAFYDLMFNQGKPAEAIERYVGDVYIQHNPAVACSVPLKPRLTPNGALLGDPKIQRGGYE